MATSSTRKLVRLRFDAYSLTMLCVGLLVLAGGVDLFVEAYRTNLLFLNGSVSSAFFGLFAVAAGLALVLKAIAKSSLNF